MSTRHGLPPLHLDDGVLEPLRAGVDEQALLACRRRRARPSGTRRGRSQGGGPGRCGAMSRRVSMCGYLRRAVGRAKSLPVYAAAGRNASRYAAYAAAAS